MEIYNYWKDWNSMIDDHISGRLLEYERSLSDLPDWVVYREIEAVAVCDPSFRRREGWKVYA
jgi:hypothetical protein